MNEIPASFENEEQLEQFLAVPYPETVEMMKRLEGDILILGAGGKMGPSLARVALNACRQAGVEKSVIGVDLFPEPEVRESLERCGVETLAADLLDPAQCDALPRVRNIIFMVGRKFGEVGSQDLTWMMNTIVPAHVARTFNRSHFVVFSTGCVYALVSEDGPGSVETDAPLPVGEYANSCLGRERVFEYHSRQYHTPGLLFRLNYAIDLRYGVLADIAQCIYEGTPVDRSVGRVNVIWQGDAVNRALLSLEHTATPPAALNVTGRETLSVEELAGAFAKELGKPVSFRGVDSGKAYLSDASRSLELFGAPRISTPTMIRWVADWIKRGGRLLGKPTHYQVTDGQFLDER